MLHRIAAAVVLATIASLPSARAETPADWAAKNTSDLVEVYRWFHQHPELSSQETETAAHLAELWKKAGVEVHTGVGGTGIVGILKNGPGPTLMLRTDLDALPVVENTGLVYASQVKVKNKDGSQTGVMHACGHDIHMTNLIGVAQFLTSHKSDWSGTVMLVGQPAEERGEGARRMLDDGLFTKFPKPDMALALHVDAHAGHGQGRLSGRLRRWPTSTASTSRCTAAAATAPRRTPTIDPIVQAAAIHRLAANAGQPRDEPRRAGRGHRGLDSRRHQAQRHSRRVANCNSPCAAIRDEVRATTARRHSPQGQRRGRRGRGAQADGRRCSTRPRRPCSTTKSWSSASCPSFASTLGEENVVPSEQSMGGEDFSRYGRAGVPIFMFRLGSVEPKRLAGLKRGGAGAAVAALGDLLSRRRSRRCRPASRPLARPCSTCCRRRNDGRQPSVGCDRTTFGRLGRKKTLLWLAAYMVLVVGVVFAMLHVRARTLRTMDTPEARAEWQAWREAEPNQNRDRAGRAPPAQRHRAAGAGADARLLRRDAVGRGRVQLAAVRAITIAARGVFATSLPLARRERCRAKRGG